MSAIRIFLQAVERWCFDEESAILGAAKMFFVIGVGLSPLLALLIWASVAESRECARVGGRMRQTGTRTMLVYNAATKTAMPQQVAITECIIGEVQP